MNNSNTKSKVLFNKAQLEFLRSTYQGIINTKVSPKLSDRDIMYNAGILEVINKIAELTPEEHPKAFQIPKV